MYEDKIREMNLSILGLKYPVFENINLFKEYHDFIENNLKNAIGKIDDKQKFNKETSNQLTMEFIINEVEINKFNEFRNIMRVSLFISVYAYIEKIITYPCIIEGRRNEYEEYKRKESKKIPKKSIIEISRNFL